MSRNSLAERLLSNRIQAQAAPEKKEEKPPSSSSMRDRLRRNTIQENKTEHILAHKEADPQKSVANLQSLSSKAGSLRNKLGRQKAEPMIVEYDPDHVFAQEEDFIIDETQAEKERFLEERREKRYTTTTKIISGVLIAAIFYIIMLIYGVIVTNYQYTTEGRVAPQVMSVSDIREAKDFQVIMGQYEKCRMLYEKVLMLDYRLAQGLEEPMTLAPEYEALLEEDKEINVNDLAVKTDALEINAKYSQIKDIMLSWIQNDIALYLQNMAAAISTNNADTANNALIDRDNTYYDFMTLTQNVVVIGETIKGVDMTEIKEWTPEDFVDQQINGAEQ